LKVRPSPSNGYYFLRWLPAEKTASLRPGLCIGVWLRASSP
jgi:hypothetical protein